MLVSIKDKVVSLKQKMNSTKDILKTLETPVDVGALIESLPFDLDNFEQVNREQPGLYLEASRFLTWAVLEKGRADVKLETREAEIGLDLRKGEKVTDKAVLAQVAADPEIVKLKQKVYLAKASEVWAKQLVETFNHRQQAINNITRIRTAETTNALRSVKERAEVLTVRREAERMRQKYDREQK